MSGKRIETLIWGSVISNGKKYYLLEPTPEKSRKVWMLEGTLEWQVTEENYRLVRDENSEEKFTPVYRASNLIFGKDACVELLDNPQTVILVEYFSPEEVFVAPV